MFETFQAVMMLILFLVPGYLWWWTESQLVYVDRRLGWEKFAFGLLVRSSVVYLPYASFLYRGWENKIYASEPWLTSLAALIFLVLLPIAFGFFAGVIRQRGWVGQWLNRIKVRSFEKHHAPSAWDALFSELPQCWVVVTLKNGGKVSGFFGVGSHVSSDPENRDIYISQVLVADATGKWDFVKKTRGIYVRADEISTIEFKNK